MRRRAAVLLSILLVAGCATGRIRPGTGDISFRLLWTGESDLDLYVVSPLDERIDFVRRASASGGLLDVDCNVRTAIETNICSEPMENIFWPKGKAPVGEYRFWTFVSDAHGLKDEDVFKLEIRKGRNVVRTEVGRVIDLRDEPPIWTIDYEGPSRAD